MQKPEKIRTKAKLRLINFLRPDCFPYPYAIEQAFHVFQWMVLTGKDYTKYGRPGVFELLSMSPSCLGFSSVRSITSLEDLRRRFHYALLSVTEMPLVAEWKRVNGISIEAEKWLHFPHYTPFIGNPLGSERDIQDALSKLLGQSRGTTLNTSLNSCHPGARWVGGVSIIVSPSGFKFVMDYGFVEDTGWSHTLAESENNEPFTDVLRRAIAALASMTAQNENTICPDCGGLLELQRTEVFLGITREVYTCVETSSPYVKDTSDPDGKPEHAVKCTMCNNLCPRSSSHVLNDNFIGECCWDER